MLNLKHKKYNSVEYFTILFLSLRHEKNKYLRNGRPVYIFKITSTECTTVRVVTVTL
jgi:hypothetical protein